MLRFRAKLTVQAEAIRSLIHRYDGRWTYQACGGVALLNRWYRKMGA